MRCYRLIGSWTLGFDFGDSGFYRYARVWCRPRFRPSRLGSLEIRVYRREWWRSYYDRKGKLTWKGTVLDIK